MNLQQAVDMVRHLRPGQRVAVDRRELEFGVLVDGFKPEDRVLENITGSAYEFIHYEHFPTRRIVFERLPKPLTGDDGVYSYVSPDRREYYDRTIGGLYKRNDKPYGAGRT